MLQKEENIKDEDPLYIYAKENNKEEILALFEDPEFFLNPEMRYKNKEYKRLLIEIFGNELDLPKEKLFSTGFNKENWKESDFYQLVLKTQNQKLIEKMESGVGFTEEEMIKYFPEVMDTGKNISKENTDIIKAEEHSVDLNTISFESPILPANIEKSIQEYIQK